MREPIAIFHMINDNQETLLKVIDYRQLELMILIARIAKIRFYTEWN